MRQYLGKALRCRFKMTREDMPKASFSDIRKPAEIAAQFPNLRPCKLADWKWIYRTSCDYCKFAVFEGQQETTAAAPTPANGYGIRQPENKTPAGDQTSRGVRR